MLTLWGGTDVDSMYYNAIRHSKAQRPDTARDRREIADYYRAVANGEPILGICRGAQLISILNGASLYQHSEGHNRDHDVFCKYDDSFVAISNVAADHHQIINLDNCKTEFKILGFSNFPTKVWLDETTVETISAVPEVIWFPQTKALAVQPHPEWMDKNHEFNVWLDKQCINYLGESLWHFGV